MNIDLNLFVNWVIVATDIANNGAICSIPDIQVYVLVVTLWTQDNAKLFERLNCFLK